MTLKSRLDEQAFQALPDHLRTEYRRQADGAYLLDVEAIVDGKSRWALEDVGGLRATLQAYKNERDEFHTRLGAYKDLDPEAARAALAKADEMAKWTPEDEVQKKIEARVKSIEEKIAADRKSYEDQLAKIKAEKERSDASLLDEVKRNAATIALQKAGVRPEAVDLCARELAPRLGVVAENGRRAVYAVDGDGRALITKKEGQTGNMTVEELVETEFKNRMAFAFQGSKASGTGASGSESGQMNGNQIDPNASPEERLAAYYRGAPARR